MRFYTMEIARFNCGLSYCFIEKDFVWIATFCHVFTEYLIDVFNVILRYENKKSASQKYRERTFALENGSGVICQRSPVIFHHRDQFSCLPVSRKDRELLPSFPGHFPTQRSRSPMGWEPVCFQHRTCINCIPALDCRPVV